MQADDTLFLIVIRLVTEMFPCSSTGVFILFSPAPVRPKSRAIKWKVSVLITKSLKIFVLFLRPMAGNRRRINLPMQDTYPNMILFAIELRTQESPPTSRAGHSRCPAPSSAIKNVTGCRGLPTTICDGGPASAVSPSVGRRIGGPPSRRARTLARPRLARILEPPAGRHDAPARPSGAGNLKSDGDLAVPVARRGWPGYALAMPVPVIGTVTASLPGPGRGRVRLGPPSHRAVPGTDR